MSSSRDPILGEITFFGGTFAPHNWAFCDGQLLAISQYQALFSIIGSQFGGDGRSSFALPDFRGRLPVGTGQRPGSVHNYQLGEKAGQTYVTLSEANMPAHTHGATLNHMNIYMYATTADGTQSTPATGSVLAKGIGSNGVDVAQYISSTATPTPTTVNLGGVETPSGTSDNTGDTGLGDQQFNLMPYYAIHAIICTNGLYPSFN